MAPADRSVARASARRVSRSGKCGVGPRAARDSCRPPARQSNSARGADLRVMLHAGKTAKRRRRGFSASGAGLLDGGSPVAMRRVSSHASSCRRCRMRLDLVAQVGTDEVSAPRGERRVAGKGHADRAEPVAGLCQREPRGVAHCLQHARLVARAVDGNGSRASRSRPRRERWSSVTPSFDRSGPRRKRSAPSSIFIPGAIATAASSAFISGTA